MYKLNFFNPITYLFIIGIIIGWFCFLIFCAFRDYIFPAFKDLFTFIREESSDLIPTVKDFNNIPDVHNWMKTIKLYVKIKQEEQ